MIQSTENTPTTTEVEVKVLVQEQIKQESSTTPTSTISTQNVTAEQGKVVIVTGSTSGIGLGIVQVLARNGCTNIVLNGTRSLDDAKEGVLKELQEEFGASGIKVVYCQADFAENPEEAAKALIQTAVTHFGTVHILVNNAGIQHVSCVDDFAPEMWTKVMNVNLNGPFHCIRLALPLMKKNENKWGRIINISSVHGIVASVNKAAYVAAKHALNGLSKVVALENASQTSITSNCICPGWVHTPLVQKQIESRATAKNLSIEDATVDLLSEKQPSRKFTTSEQIGKMVVFLCSDAADNITGTEQVMDGGWTAV